MHVAQATIAPITVAELERETAELTKAHYAEVTLDPDHDRLAPNWPYFRAAESLGSLLTLGIRIDGKLVGYSVSTITPHHHYRDTIVCSNLSLFLDEAHRGGRLGVELMRETERLAKARGAHRMAWHCKEGTKLHRMLDHQTGDYRLQDLIYTRRLT